MKKTLLAAVALTLFASPTLAVTKASPARSRDAQIAEICKRAPEFEKKLASLKKAEDNLYVTVHGTKPPPGSVSGTYSYYRDWYDAGMRFCSRHNTAQQ